MIARFRLTTTLMVVLLGFTATPPTRPAPSKEFLTPKEIEKLQDTQEIDQRIRVYLDAAALRLRAAMDRLGGKEAEEGDPLELFTVEEMIDGYYRIMKSVMINLDDVYKRTDSDKTRLGRALQALKEGTEWAGKVLLSLKKTAEEKQKEELWNAVNQSIDIANGAREGAELGLKKYPAPAQKSKGKNKT
jgi:hypothetical protein